MSVATEYRVGLVAELVGGTKSTLTPDRRLSNLFSAPKYVKPSSTKLKSADTLKPITKTAETAQKQTDIAKEGKRKKTKPSASFSTASDQIVHTPGYCPPQGIIHESLQASQKKVVKKPGGKRKKASVDDNDREDEKNEPKRPRRDRLKKADENRTVFVGNVPLSCNKKRLTKLFKGFGEIESIRFRCPPLADPTIPKKVAVIKKEFHDQRHNIVAYICFKEKESAEKALCLNSHVEDGLHLRVDLAKSKHDNKRSVFVGNLPFTIEEENVRAFFEDCGEIENVRIIRDRKTNLGKGFCYILFQSKDSVSLALNMKSVELDGRHLRIQRCSEYRKANPATNKKPATTKTIEALAECDVEPGDDGPADKRKLSSTKSNHPGKSWQPSNASKSFQGNKTRQFHSKKAAKHKKKKKTDAVTRALGPSISLQSQGGQKTMKKTNRQNPRSAGKGIKIRKR